MLRWTQLLASYPLCSTAAPIHMLAVMLLWTQVPDPLGGPAKSFLYFLIGKLDEALAATIIWHIVVHSS
jgi:hypothetical protein